MIEEKGNFEYLKVSDNLLCRYPLVSGTDGFHIIGEIYDKKSENWITKSSTMRYKMSGEYDVISEEEAFQMINRLKGNE